MRSIDRFVFSKGDRGRNGVQDVIVDGQPVDPRGTSIACQPGAEICTFKARLLDDFFYPAKVDSEHELPPSFTVIQGNGAVSMEFATRGGRRRVLRGTIALQRSRHAQASVGSLAGTDDIQILDIPISEQERGTGDDTDTGGTSLADKWKSLPTWAKALSCIGIAAIILFCCGVLGFFGWFVGVESSKRKVQEQTLPKFVASPRAAPMNGDFSGRTVDDDGSSLRSSGRYCFPARINQQAQPPTAKQSHLDSSNRSSTQGRRPVRNNKSDGSVASGRRDPRTSSNNFPKRVSRSHSPQLFRSTYDSTMGNFREKNIPSRNPRMSAQSPTVPLSLSGGSNHGRSVGGSASVSRPSIRRHASLGPGSVQTRRTHGLSQSQHTGTQSHLPRRSSSNLSDSNRNNFNLSSRCNHANRPLTRNSYQGARTTNGLSQSQHDGRLPRRSSAFSVSGSSSHNKNNLDLSSRSTHSNRPLTRNSYHGTTSLPGRVVPRHSLGPNTTGRSEHPRGSNNTTNNNNNHGPPRIRIPVRSDQGRRLPGKQPPQFVHVAHAANSSSSDDDDDDDIASFASASTTQVRQGDTESLSESIRNQIKKPVKNIVKANKVASSPPLARTNSKTPIKKSKAVGSPTLPARGVSTTELGETRRESVKSLPNDKNRSTIKKVVTKKKKKKKKEVTEESPTISEEKQEESWGDQLD